MCGISGFAAPGAVPSGIIAAMTAIIRHRGPDDEGYALFETAAAMPRLLAGPDTPSQAFQSSCPYAPAGMIAETGMAAMLGFGHRRLSIVDLSPLGHQPMSDRNGRYWITYNGEIYNYPELRGELEQLGHRFLSQTDTEVILAAYAQWGSACLHRFNGMWAFALYDRAERKLFLARDRFGVKPLYYWVSPEGAFFFASEIKQFTVLPGWRACVNGQRAYDFLVWGITDHTDETLFRGVYHLRPGHFIELEIPFAGSLPDGRVPSARWYELKAASFTGSFPQAAQEFRSLLTDSVALRLRGDVPVGSCLSGGLDSSSIVCLMNELLRKQNAVFVQKTFSACAALARFDERPWVDKVVNHTGVDSHYIYPAADKLFAEAPAIIWHQDEPFGSTSIYAQWNVFRLAAQNSVVVMLDGQGADEQLAGYHSFFAFRFADLLRRGRWVRLVREIRLAKKLHGYRWRDSLVQMASVLLPGFLKMPLRKMAGRSHASPVWLDLDRLRARPGDPHRQSGSSLKSLSFAQMTAMNIQMLLHWEDRDSMAHSIESRVPFLDYRLVEFSLGLPDGFKLSDGITKRVLRAGMSGVIPDQIRDRMDKLGFATPEEHWIRHDAAALFREELRNSIAASRGILSAECLSVLDDVIAGKKPFSFLIWRMISFGLWMKTFSVELSPAAPEGGQQ